MRSIGSYLAQSVGLCLILFAAAVGLVIAFACPVAPGWAGVGEVVAAVATAGAGAAWITQRTSDRLRQAITCLVHELHPTGQGALVTPDPAELLITELAETRQHLLQRRLLEMRAQEDLLCQVRAKLHDRVQQDLGALLTQLELVALSTGPLSPATAERLALARHLARGAIAQIDLTVQRLRPWALDVLGLVAALEQAVDHLQQHGGLQVELEWIGDTGAAGRLDRPTADGVYRMIESCLTRAKEVGKAGFVHIAVDASATGQLIVQVSDDGIGQTPRTLGTRLAHAMDDVAARVLALGGNLRIEPSKLPGVAGGTCVVARFPLDG